MSTATESQLYRSLLNRSPSIADPPASLMTPLLKPLTQIHPSSLASITQEQPYVNIPLLSQQHRPNPTPFVKNRNLLVAARLALRRQRAALKGPTLQYEPTRSDTLQMELASRDETFIDQHRDVLISSSLSNHTIPFRQESPQTVPADVSLMFR